MRLVKKSVGNRKSEPKLPGLARRSVVVQILIFSLSEIFALDNLTKRRIFDGKIFSKVQAFKFSLTMCDEVRR